ncbi:MAG: sugar ABC transporter ATP-binding protein [Bryobacteraceae bacterium]
MGKQLVLQVRNLSKSFPGVRALDGVSLDVEAGKVHAVTGENGAGKSTLMRILAGLQTPDSGEILFQGHPIRIGNPHEALRMGISMIHQELLPFPDLTVAENIWMGREPARLAGWLDKPAMNREARLLLERLGVALSPVTRMRELGVAEAQTVEIAKALACRAEVIIMDEPSSALSGREVGALFEVIGDLKRRGVAVIYISHKMDEIFRVSDTVTVLRDGRHVATAETGEMDENRLIALMVGRALDAAPPRGRADLSDVVLEVRELTKAGRFRRVSFAVRRGEILGIAGLMGAGRTSLVSAISGLAPAETGEIRVGGRLTRIRSPRDAIANGIAFVSEDRKEYGLVPTMSVTHNITLASLSRCCRGPFLDKRAENRIANNQIRAFSIGGSSHDPKVTLLSGGNQQKVVIAKALLTEPAILILDEPTRGIDIGAKAEIYATIGRLAGEGKAILMVSSEMAEILSLSDRILVMREGGIAAELSRERATQEGIMKWAVPK